MEADAGMTMTGDILGTLRYMSPEQALAKRAVVDHRSDIYSLGVTLYELLTLEPAFTGDDRHELLRQISFEEPTKPRQINSHIPQELETIVLKAIEKNPTDRYATAQDLRNDLVAFLENRPVVARPASLLLRTRKLVRRHRPVFLATAITLAVAIALGALGLLIAFSRERVQRQTAQRHLTLAREAVDEMLTKVASTWVPDSTATTELQRQFLDRALTIYQQLAAEPPDGDPRGDDAAQAYERIADIRSHLGNIPAAIEAWRMAIGIHNELAARDGPTPVRSEALVRCYRKLTDAQGNGQPTAEALELADRGIELAKPLIAKGTASPELHIESARLLYGQAKLLVASDKLAEALDVITKAEDVAAQVDGQAVNSPDEFEVLLRLANLRTAVLCRQDRFEEAAELNRETRNCMRLVDATMFDSKPMIELRADFQENQADVLIGQDKHQEAAYELRSALNFRQQRLGGQTAIQLYRAVAFGQRVSRRHFEQLAVAEYCDTQLRLAALLSTTGRPLEAQRMFGEALYIAEYINESISNLPQFAVLYANASAAVAEYLADERPQEAEQFLRLAAAVWNDARAAFPPAERFRSGLHGERSDWDWFRTAYPDYAGRSGTRKSLEHAHWKTAMWSRTWGNLFYQSESWLVASRHFANAIKRDNFTQTSDLLNLAMAYAQLGETEKAQAEYETAVARMRELPQPDAELELLRDTAARLLAEKVTSDANGTK
jgi:tetratricopeptide (TPR) repeat protein